MTRWILLIVSVLLAIFHSWWWWLAVLGMSLWCYSQWWFYRSRPWRKLYYPLMRLYARAAGLENAQAQNEGCNFDVKKALAHVIKTVRPYWEDQQILAFIAKEIDRSERFEDSDLIAAELRRRKPNLKGEELQEVVQTVRKCIHPSDNASIVRAVIAGLVEDEHGKSQRGEYLIELALGNAK